MKTPSRKTCQLKVSLKGAKPPIWRRILVDASMPLVRFHDALQIAMGWHDCHLHQFIANGQIYGAPDEEFGFPDMHDEAKYKLSHLLKEAKDNLVYEYDFGDGWRHEITLEKVLPSDPKASLPRCVKAKGACPPEDVGGLWGYYHLLEALSDPNHPDHESFKRWTGGRFDPDAYDIERVNRLLKKHC